MHSEINKLYGDLKNQGVSLAHHTSSSSFSKNIGQGALHVILNLSGSAILLSETLRVNLSPNTMIVFHRANNEPLTASRLQSDRSDSFLVLSVTTDWISKTFGSNSTSFHPTLRKILSSSQSDDSSLGKMRSLSLAEKDIAHDLLCPPVPPAAKQYWFLAKILEILTHHLFTSDNFNQSEPFCSTIKRINRTRTEQSISWLKENLDQPLNLSSLAKSVGCSPHYLSRLFKKSTGVTLKQKHRQLRIDFAAQLLRHHDYNVTEAALEVGYNSLSHFSKAFQEETGMLPSECLE